MLAPVILFVYNRPHHTQITVESLINARLAKDSELFIFSDGPKGEYDAEAVNKVRAYISSLDAGKAFKSVRIIASERNKGLANSIISGVSEVFMQHAKAIVIEDDLQLSPDFLEYMNAGLQYYMNHSSIWSITGYTFDVDIPKNYRSDVYLAYRGCSWSWGTWSDRWNLVDWEVKDYEAFRTNPERRRTFNRGGRDMAAMLDAQMEGKIDSWAIRWCYAQSKADMFTIYPITSRVRNIGLDGTGTHSGISEKYDAVLTDGCTQCVFDMPGFEPAIVNSFRDQFGTELDFYKQEAARQIKNLLESAEEFMLEASNAVCVVCPSQQFDRFSSSFTHPVKNMLI